jgi:diguanylate cyclase (GGDEF)-like protein/PAS domain S-box-containing protein
VIVLWNRRATELYGYELHEAQGHDINELSISAPAELGAAIRATVADQGSWSGEFVTSRKDGTAIPILATVEKIEAPEIGFAGVVSASIDNSVRRALQVTLAHQALHDPLTSLPNRALFLDRLDRALARLRRHPGTIAVLFLDLDRFKIVNDTCGHHVGDEILRAVASLFEGVLRPEDTVARLGGDEFAVCCEQLEGPAEAVALAERLTAAVSQPFVLGGREFYVTPSIGIVLGTGVLGETASTLLRDADAAMYHAKDRGRGRIELFDHGMRTEVLRKAEVAGELRHAAERGELVLHYQPIMRLADGALTGFEALLRWDHPERGLLLPGAFIDVAEDSDLIVSIGAWVLGEAGRQLAAWRDELPEHPITMSVNLAARQIADLDLVATVREMLARYQLEPSRLTLEITEGTLMEDAEVSVATLRELKALGVQLAIDDFGTGYSSLAYLKRFPIDFLKIDRSFVSGLEHESEDAVIVKAVVELGRALGLGVVAEGVETDGQLAELERIGCELAPGYRGAGGAVHHRAAVGADPRARDTAHRGQGPVRATGHAGGRRAGGGRGGGGCGSQRRTHRAPGHHPRRRAAARCRHHRPARHAVRPGGAGGGRGAAGRPRGPGGRAGRRPARPRRGGRPPGRADHRQPAHQRPQVQSAGHADRGVVRDRR